MKVVGATVRKPRAPRVVKLCLFCRKPFRMLESRSKGGVNNQKFCSQECYLDSGYKKVPKGPSAKPKKPLAQRFWEKVDIALSNDCWEWTGTKQSRGYGMIANPDGPTPLLAHRVSLCLSGVEVPDHMHVLHKCDNPGCVRPDHLFVGTAADNSHDMYRKGRHKCPQGECHPRRKLTEDQVRKIRREVAEGKMQTELAAEYSVHPASINAIISGRTWRHVL